MVGPNCLGIINLKDNARIGFGGTAQLKTLKPGPMAMVTQSGGFGFGVVAIAAHFGVGCNYAISTGNEADLSLLDWIADLIERDDVEVVVAFMEAIDDGRRLLDIGQRALQLGKPVSSGRSAIPTSARPQPRTRRGLLRLRMLARAFRRAGRSATWTISSMSRRCSLPQAADGNSVGVLTLSGGAGAARRPQHRKGCACRSSRRPLPRSLKKTRSPPPAPTRWTPRRTATTTPSPLRQGGGAADDPRGQCPHAARRSARVGRKPARLLADRASLASSIGPPPRRQRRRAPVLRKTGCRASRLGTRRPGALAGVLRQVSRLPKRGKRAAARRRAGRSTSTRRRHARRAPLQAAAAAVRRRR